LGFKWLFEVFCPASAFVTADSNDARNPQHFIYVTVQYKKTTLPLTVLILPEFLNSFIKFTYL